MNCVYTPIAGDFDFVGDFSDGLAFVRNREKKCGYIDKLGEIVIPLEYACEANCRFVSPQFCEGFAALFKNGKAGFVDKFGNVAVDFQYDYADGFRDGLCVVRKGNLHGAINTCGELVVPFEYDMLHSFCEDLAPAIKSGQTGYINKNGGIAIPFAYDYAPELNSQFSEGFALVESNGCKGYIDKRGEVAIPFGLEYDEAQSFHKGLAAVVTGIRADVTSKQGESSDEFRRRIDDARRHQRWGMIDRAGNVAIPVEYERICYTAHGVSAINADTQHFYNENGDFMFAMDYDYVGHFFSGLSTAKKGNMRCFINEVGEIEFSLPEGFDDVGSFFDGYAAVSVGEKYGFIDKAGNITVPVEYDSVSRFRDNAAVVKRDNKWGILKLLL
ncbi:MAG: WG repeat-containing protein [Oscillospiraceae bacterium]|jgi:hypothetical protein|nr:WG repeat-containing protein [Oscillospiraceae bacterium]